MFYSISQLIPFHFAFNLEDDFDLSKREIERIVSGYESEYIYLGKDMEKIAEIKKKYDDVYFALSNPILTMDSIGLMFLKRR